MKLPISHQSLLQRRHFSTLCRLYCKGREDLLTEALACPPHIMRYPNQEQLRSLDAPGAGRFWSGHAVLLVGYDTKRGWVPPPPPSHHVCSACPLLSQHPNPGRPASTYSAPCRLQTGCIPCCRLFKIQNSWGTGPRSGLKGYFYIPFWYMVHPKLTRDFWMFNDRR
jgi:hypothetical protein